VFPFTAIVGSGSDEVALLLKNVIDHASAG